MKNILCLIAAILILGCTEKSTTSPDPIPVDELEPLEEAVAKDPWFWEVYGSNALPELQISPCVPPYSVVYQGDTIIAFSEDNLGGNCFFVSTALIKGERYIYIDYTTASGYRRGKLFIGKDLILSKNILYFSYLKDDDYVIVYSEDEKEVWCTYNDSTRVLTEKGRL
jgi:hypothetical protein